MNTNKRKPGRPVAAAGRAKTESILLKMTPDEKQGFTDAAINAGIPLSVWIRERLRLVASKELKAAGKSVAWEKSKSAVITVLEDGS
jgi:hypothetical protein